MIIEPLNTDLDFSNYSITKSGDGIYTYKIKYDVYEDNDGDNYDDDVSINYNVHVLELVSKTYPTTEKPIYIIDHEKGYVYIRHDTNAAIIKSNLDIKNDNDNNKNNNIFIENNQIKIKYENEVLKTYDKTSLVNASNITDK